MKKHILRFAKLVARALFSVFISGPVIAQFSPETRVDVIAANDSASTRGVHDQLFPGRGAATVFAHTGIPFPVSAELSYGLSDGFTMSALAGVTWTNDWGFGIRPRVVLGSISDDVRVEARALALFYPEVPDAEAWALLWPQFNVEVKTGDIRWSAGLGAVATACTDALLGIGNHANGPAITHEHLEHHGHESSGMTDEEMREIMASHEDAIMGGGCASMQVGVSAPVGNGFVLHGDAYAIFSGEPLFGRGWSGAVPYVIAIGASYRLF